MKENKNILNPKEKGPSRVPQQLFVVPVQYHVDLVLPVK